MKPHIMEAQDIDNLARAALEAPERADKALMQMKEVRELIYKLISAIARQDTNIIENLSKCLILILPKPYHINA